MSTGNAMSFRKLNSSSKSILARAAKPVFDMLEQRRLLASFTVDDDFTIATPGWNVTHFKTIQAAVTEAVSNVDTTDDITVEPGIYKEQVNIALLAGHTLTIAGSGQGSTTILAPDDVTNSAFVAISAGGNVGGKSVVAVNGGIGSHITIRDLTVDGANRGTTVNGDSPTPSDFFGIGIRNSNALVDDVTVVNVRDGATAASYGPQRGRAIVAGAAGGGSYAVTVSDSTINAYQKSGIYLDGANLTATISDNVIGGAGAIDTIAQNGITLINGANGSITGNTISGHNYTPNTAAGAGILLFNAGSGVTIAGNIVLNNELAIGNSGSPSPTVTGNSLEWHVTTPEDTSIATDLVATITSVTGVVNGSVSYAGSVATFFPTANFNGTGSYNFATAGGNSGTVYVTVTPVNDAPVANDDAYEVAEDGVLTVPVGQGVLANDSDVDGDTLSGALVSGPTNGILAGNADGSFTYTPNADFHGTDTFTYTANDPYGGVSNVATVTITVTPVNDAPILFANTGLTVNENEPFNPNTATVITTARLQATDVDNTNAQLVFSVTQKPTAGVLQLNTGTMMSPNWVARDVGETFTQQDIDQNRLRYRNNGGEQTADSFKFTVSDGALSPVSQPVGGFTFSIVISPVNDVPVANPGSGETDEDVNLSDTLTGSDGENAPLTFVIVAPPTHGSFLSFNSATGAFTYKPDADYYGSDSFTFKVNDGSVDSIPVTYSINVKPVNDAPTITAPSSVLVTEDVDTQIFGISVDDPDAGAGTLTVVLSVPQGTLSITGGNDSVVTGSGTGTVTISGTQAAVNAKLGNLFYKTLLNSNATTSLSISVNDNGNTGGGPKVDLKSVTINITPVNDKPVITYTPATVTYNENAAAITVFAGALSISDVESNGLTSAVITLTNFVTGQDVLTISGSLPTGITLASNSGGVITLTINPATAGAAGYSSVVTAIKQIRYANSSENPDTTTRTFTLTVTDNGSPAVATSDVVSQDVAVVAVNDKPVITYTPATVSYTENAAAIQVFAGALSISDVESNGLTSAVITLTNFVTGQDVLSISGALPTGITSNISGGVITLTINPATAGAAGYSSVVTAIKQIRYANSSENPDTTTRTFTLTVTDNGSPSETSATVSQNVTVISVNDAPTIAAPSSVTVTEDDPSPVAGISVNDVEAAIAGNVSVILAVPTGTLSVTGGNDSVVSGSGTGTVTLFGTLTQVNAKLAALFYKTALNSNASTSLSILVNDNGNTGTGGPLGAAGSVAITVTPVNDPPVAVNDGGPAFTLAEDPIVTPVTLGNVLANDTDPDGDTLVVWAVNGVTGDVGQEVTITGGKVVIAANGAVTFKPNTNYYGSTTVNYTITDGNSEFSTATLTITVTPVNDAPLAKNGSISTSEDVAVDGVAEGIDDDGDTLTYALYSPASHGTVVLNPNGTYTYTPAANYFGPDSFQFTVSDGVAPVSAPATISITVTPVNDPPTANDDYVTTAEDTASAPFNVVANDTDIDGDVLNVTGPTSGTTAKGSWTRVGNLFTYTPNLNENGADSFTYVVSDGNGGTATGTVNITITPVNDAPTAVNDGPFAVVQSQTTTGNAVSNDFDVDGDALTVIAASGTTANGGTYSILANGSYSYTAPGAYLGLDSFTYTLTDNGGVGGAGHTSTATVSFNVVLPTFRASTVTMTPSGFDIQFNRAFNVSQLNQYTNATLNQAPDIIVTGPGGTVSGSIVVTGSNTISFIASGGTLSGVYQITLKSGPTGFQDTAGAQLDGNSNGVAGDDYVSVLSRTAATRVLSIPDFARGQSQSLSSDVAIPVRINGGNSLSSAEFDVVVDSSVLSITGFTLSAAAQSVNAELVAQNMGGGVWHITITTPASDIPTTGTTDLVVIQGSVVSGAGSQYGSGKLVRVLNTEVSTNDASIQPSSEGDTAVHAIAYFGDLNGSGFSYISGGALSSVYSVADTTLMQRLVAKADTGLAPNSAPLYRLLDPALIANLNGLFAGDGYPFTAADTTLMQRIVAGLEVAQVPSLPGLTLPRNGAILPDGADVRAESGLAASAVKRDRIVTSIFGQEAVV